MSGGGRRRPDRHGWNALPKYLQIHERRLDDFRGDFVLDDNLVGTFVGRDHYRIVGRIACRHGLFIDVDKTLEINRRGQARTVRYDYHAGIVGPEGKAVFRYDNAHGCSGHPDHHHRHRFDVQTWGQIEPPEWVGHGAWPYLSDVIEELRNRWEATGQHLGLDVPDGSDDEAADSPTRDG